MTTTKDNCNIQPINPSIVTGVRCCACHSWKGQWADLNGEPFKAFYCNDCSIARQQVEITHFDDRFPVGGGRLRVTGPSKGVVEQAAREQVLAIDKYRSPYADPVTYNTQLNRWQTEVRWYTLD